MTESMTLRSFYNAPATLTFLLIGPVALQPCCSFSRRSPTPKSTRQQAATKNMNKAGGSAHCYGCNTCTPPLPLWCTLLHPLPSLTAPRRSDQTRRNTSRQSRDMLSFSPRRRRGLRWLRDSPCRPRDHACSLGCDVGTPG